MNYKIILDDDKFWDWLCPKNESEYSGINTYLKFICENQIDKGYIIDMSCEHEALSHSEIMDNLCRCMPREYYLEIQFCARIYASFFGKVFPPLAAQIDQLAYIEWLLYTEPSNLRYRDHLIHMFKVAYVIDCFFSFKPLLKKIVKWQFRSRHFKEWCKEQNILVDTWTISEREEIIKVASFFTSLFHDMGYGYFFLRGYKRRLSKLYEWLLPEADPTDVDSSTTKILLNSLPAYFIQENHAWLCGQNSYVNMDNIILGFFHDCLPLNHSTASAFFVINIAEMLRKSRALTQNLYVAFQLAAEASMIHDMTDETRWVHFQKQGNDHFITPDNHKDVPLALLLILADGISIWNRPVLKSDPCGDYKVVNQLDRKNITERIEITIIERNGQNEIRIISDRKMDKLQKTFNEDLNFLKNNKNDKFSEILGYKLNV